MGYPQAEAVIGGRSKSFIADLMPPSPVYVALLPEAAQWALGQLHPVGEIPFGILQDEGFDADSYVDIFDGGPTVEAPLSALRSVRAARRVQLASDTEGGVPRRWHLLVQASRPQFAAVLAELPERGVAVSAADVAGLGHPQLDALWVTPLERPIDGGAV
jgi:arginine N-succinyltransferase